VAQRCEQLAGDLLRHQLIAVDQRAKAAHSHPT
jgi:hypothetical protein